MGVAARRGGGGSERGGGCPWRGGGGCPLEAAAATLGAAALGPPFKFGDGARMEEVLLS